MSSEEFSQAPIHANFVQTALDVGQRGSGPKSYGYYCYVPA